MVEISGRIRSASNERKEADSSEGGREGQG